MAIDQYSDLDRRLAPTNKGDIEIVEDVAAIEQSLINIIMTKKGERLHRPQFGSRIHYAIGQPMTERAARRIRSAVADTFRQEDRAQLNETKIVHYKRENKTKVTIFWSTPFATEDQKTSLYITDNGVEA